VILISAGCGEFFLDIRKTRDDYIVYLTLAGGLYSMFIENAMVASYLHRIYTRLQESNSILSVVYLFPNPTAGWIVFMVQAVILTGRRVISPIPFNEKEVAAALGISLLLSWRAKICLEAAYHYAKEAAKNEYVQEYIQLARVKMDESQRQYQEWRDDKMAGGNVFRSEKIAELETLFHPDNKQPPDVNKLQECDIPFSKKELFYRIKVLEELIQRGLHNKHANSNGGKKLGGQDVAHPSNRTGATMDTTNASSSATTIKNSSTTDGNALDENGKEVRKDGSAASGYFGKKKDATKSRSMPSDVMSACSGLPMTMLFGLVFAMLYF
jgi:hypothetical protein